MSTIGWTGGQAASLVEEGPDTVWFRVPKCWGDDQALLAIVYLHEDLTLFPPRALKSRLFGGFPCDDEEYRHVYLLKTGMDPDLDSELDRSARQFNWVVSIIQGTDFCGGGPFCREVGYG